jgi:hypothetical protein
MRGGALSMRGGALSMRAHAKGKPKNPPKPGRCGIPWNALCPSFVCGLIEAALPCGLIEAALPCGLIEAALPESFIIQNPSSKIQN